MSSKALISMEEYLKYKDKGYVMKRFCLYATSLIKKDKDKYEFLESWVTLFEE